MSMQRLEFCDLGIKFSMFGNEYGNVMHLRIRITLYRCEYCDLESASTVNVIPASCCTLVIILQKLVSVIRGHFPTDGGSDVANVYGCAGLGMSLEKVRLLLVILVTYYIQNSVPNLNVLLCAV